MLKLSDDYMRVCSIFLSVCVFHNEKLEGEKQLFHSTHPHFLRPLA